MKLPDKENAYVPLSKLLNYLLSETHPIGKSKSKYLRFFGFTEANINILKSELMAIAQSEEISEAISSPHGVKYIIDGLIKHRMEILLKCGLYGLLIRGRQIPVL